MESVLLVDDNEEALNELSMALRALLPAAEADVRTWVPTRDDNQPKEAFEEKLGDNPILVVADHDLTKRGLTGLFGSSIVAWCQERAIPVGDFSRAPNTTLPSEPELFELRVPTQTEEAAPFIAAVFRGFKTITRSLHEKPALLEMKSAAQILAAMLAAPDHESQFSLYNVRLGAASGALMVQLLSAAPRDVQATSEAKRRLLSYIVGHLLLNVLRFSGPILSARALRAYIAGDDTRPGEIDTLFSPAAYQGPFHDIDAFYWLAGVDAILDTLVPDTVTETNGELHRLGVEGRLRHALAHHACPRCHGVNGGFFCPFTKTTVCQRPDCSVASNSWIPQGARICRVERDFFDEWAPVLGL